MAKSRGRKFAELVAPANGVFAAASIPTIAISKLATSTFSVNSESASLGGNVVIDSNDVTEHTNALYFTNARADARITAAALLPLAGGTMTGNLTLGDNINAYFGASTDLRIYHDGTNSHIINSTGELRITGSNIAIKSDSNKLYLGAGDDLKIYHDGSNSYIEDAGTGSLILKGGTISVNGAYTLPTSDGSANQVLQTDGSGTLSFASVSSVFSTSGSNAYYTSGSVGIGTNSPSASLHVAGSPQATTGALTFLRNGDATSSNTSFGGIHFSSSPGTDFSIGKANVNTATSLSFRNGNTGASLMELTSAGNLGIGTTQPSVPLDVGGGGGGGTVARFKGGNNNQINITHAANTGYGLLLSNSDHTNNTGYHYSTSTNNLSCAVVNVNNDALHFGTNNSLRVTINHGGYVGIGSSTPTAKLTVNGQITGGFGASTTSGTTDFNHSTNARSGNGFTLLRMDTATNGGAGGSAYYHVINYEYGSYDGNGNLTQIAIGYNDQRQFMRYRYSGTWSAWHEM